MAMIIKKAVPADAEVIAVMVKDLTDEISRRTGGKQFNVEVPSTASRCRQFLERELYAVYLAVEEGLGAAVGFVALCESHALYAEGTFGIIQEIYVGENHRSKGVGRMLVEAAKAHGLNKRWTRLELCTPPVPSFNRVVSFYERLGFEITGGRKMRTLL